MRTRFRKRARGLLLIPVFAGVFWVTALVASSVPSLLVLGVNVHGLGASYAGDPGVALAPLSEAIVNDVSRGSRGGVAPSPAVAPTRSPVHGPTASLTPTPRPTPSLSPVPSRLPLPVPSRVPILPSLLPGVVK